MNEAVSQLPMIEKQVLVYEPATASMIFEQYFNGVLAQRIVKPVEQWPSETIEAVFGVKPQRHGDLP